MRWYDTSDMIQWYCGPCNSFKRLGHFKNIHNDDDDDDDESSARRTAVYFVGFVVAVVISVASQRQTHTPAVIALELGMRARTV